MIPVAGVWLVMEANTKTGSATGNPRLVDMLPMLNNAPMPFTNMENVATTAPPSPDQVAAAGTRQLLISDLGWSQEEALETRMRLRAFEEDWNAPGMEAYDSL